MKQAVRVAKDYVEYQAFSFSGMVTTMAHELAHTCLLMHRKTDKNNLMFPSSPRGTDVTKWQRWVVRTSRHCTWW